MAGLKEIRRRISSIANTKQITRAMKLVAAAKLRRAQDTALEGRKFIQASEKVLKRIVLDLPKNFSSPLISAEDTLANGDTLKVNTTNSKDIVVVISSERGLCGAYNSNIIKLAQSEFQDSKAKGQTLDFVCLGKRATSAAQRFSWPAIFSYDGLSEDIDQWPIAEIIDRLTVLLQENPKINISVIYTQFKSVMSQEVKREEFLPLRPANTEGTAADTKGSLGMQDKILEPSSEVTFKYDRNPELILEDSLRLFLSSKFRQLILEAKASEHASRMTAMESATKNAGELIDRLKLYYNRARQTAITRELIDIVGGAEALK